MGIFCDRCSRPGKGSARHRAFQFLNSQSTQLLSGLQKLLNDLSRVCAGLRASETEFATWRDARRSFEGFVDELESRERNEDKLMNVWTKTDFRSREPACRTHLQERREFATN